jgi:hypothetical protein
MLRIIYDKVVLIINEIPDTTYIYLTIQCR